MGDDIIANQSISSQQISKNSLEKFEEELIKLYLRVHFVIEGENVEVLKNAHKKFCDKLDKSEFKKEIIEWFDNNCEVIEDRKRRGAGYLNDRMVQELFVSMIQSLKIEPDSEFYKFLDTEFDDISRRNK